MSAIEFVKKHGINNAKAHLSNMLSVQIDDYIQDHINDLKQIVEAWELVQSYGGYSEVKWQTENKIMYINNQEHDLVKAVNLMKQCQ